MNMPAKGNARRVCQASRLALGVSLCAIAQPQTAISWDRMIWWPSNTGGKTIEHAALLVEVRIDGLKNPVLMQLDTGCDVDLVYGAPYDQFGNLPPRHGRQVTLSGTIAGSRFEDERFYVREERGWFNQFQQWAAVRWAIFKGKPIIFGTIGAEYMEQRVLVLDFAAQRIAMLPYGRDLPEAIARRIHYAPLEYRDRKMFLHLTLNGVDERYLAFDTGSSAMAIATTRRHWLEWTARQPDDPRNSLMMTEAWGKPVKLLGAPLKGSLCLGGACLDKPLAFFESTGVSTSDFDHYPFPISGLIGNVLFDGRFTVIVDLPHQRFGLYAGSLDSLFLR
jgi:hypothetical protein